MYGVAHVSPWAWVNDVGLLAVEDALLSFAISESQRDLLVAAREKAAIEASKAALEREVAERQRTERLLSLQYIVTRVLAGAHSLPEAAPRNPAHRGENQGWHVGELWEVDDTNEVLRCVDIWHADELTRQRLPGAAPRAHDRADVGLAGPRLAAPPAAVDPEPGRGADVAGGDVRGDSGLRGSFAIRCATVPRSSA